jgi:hypothetical protein
MHFATKPTSLLDMALPRILNVLPRCAMRLTLKQARRSVTPRTKRLTQAEALLELSTPEASCVTCSSITGRYSTADIETVGKDGVQQHGVKGPDGRWVIPPGTNQ